jgi:hypothetical protein
MLMGVKWVTRKNCVSIAGSTTQVEKVGENLFGLVEFFPHVVRGRPGRKKKFEEEVEKVARGTSVVTVADEILDQEEKGK